MERLGDVGEVLSETAGVVAPAMVAGRAAMPAAEAAQEAFMGVSVPARAAAETVFERLNQPGPMPETLYSNPRFEEMIAALGRGARTDQARVRREALEANDAIRADIGLPPLNPPPRPADLEPLPPPRNAAEETSDEIARLLREGKVEEAEALLNFADDRRLYQLYERGEVGLDLPMDFESAQARGREMGLVEDEFIGSMEPGIRSLDPRMARGDRRYSGTWSSDNPYVASSYADPRLGSVYPLLTRGMPEDAVRFDAQGANWRDLPGNESIDIGGRSRGPIGVNVSRMGEAGMRGNYDTNQVARIAFFEGLPGAEFRNVVDRGPQAPVDPGDPEVLREFQRRGAEPSTVRARQDTRGVRSRFARFDPRFAGSRNLMAGVGGAGVMVGASGDEEEPAVRGYAQGGEVMMRSNMPEQLHRGIGSLNEVARGMYRGGAVQGFQMGGAVGGHPLDQYGQYLAQTYAQPIQQSASDAVTQFVDSVRQKEQSYFGGGAMGGGGLMGSPMQSPMGQVGTLSGNPMQGGLMGSSADAGSTLAAPQNMTAKPSYLTEKPSYLIGQKVVDREGNELTGYGGGVLQNPFARQQLGALSVNPMQAAMQSGTFDAQVAAAANTPFIPGRRLEGGTSGYGGGVPQIPGPSGPSPFGNNLGNQQMMGQRRLDAMQPSGAAVNQANLANAQFTAPSAAPGTTIADAFASRFGENWADQFSLYTPNNRARLGIV
jgi:hypothetical protein